jgi:hypothetical protein
MKPSFLTLLAATVLSTTALSQLSMAQSVSFTCAVDNTNTPTTYAQTPEGAAEVFKWKSTYFPPPYTPMQRCQEITQRMNNYQGRGMLNYLVSGRVNGEPVICAGTRCDPSGSNLLLTLRRDQNPQQVLREIDANRQGAAGPSMQLAGGSKRSSSSASALTQNSDGSVTLNMNQYLNSAPKTPMRLPGNSQPTAPSLTPTNPSPSRPRW